MPPVYQETVPFRSTPMVPRHRASAAPVGSRTTLRPAYPNLESVDIGSPQGRSHAAQDLTLEEPQLGGPGRVVNGDHQGAVAQRYGVGVGRDLLTHQLRPMAEQRADRCRRRPTEMADETVEAVTDPTRVAFGATG